MKKIILILMMVLTASVNAGSLNLITDNSTSIIKNCTLNLHYHSNYLDFTEYYFSCSDTPQSINQSSLENNTLIRINSSSVLICEVLYSQFVNNNDFFMSINCKSQPLFKNSFE